MELYNVKTRQKELIDDEELLHKAVLSGTHSFKKGTQLTVYSPDGKRGTIPSENAAEAIKAGFTVQTGTRKAIDQYVDENKGISGALKVGLSQFADEALLGLPELIYDKTGDPLEVAKKEALKKEHDFANSLGGVAGFGASMLVGSPLWKAGAKVGEKTTAHVARRLGVEAGEEVGKRTVSKAAQDITKTIIAKGSGAAVEGGVAVMPHVITESALGDPEAAAETLLAGVGIGGMFGAVTGGAGEMYKVGKKAAAETKKLLGEQETTLKTIARRTAKVLTGVDEKDVEYAIKNLDDINKAPPASKLKDMLDDEVAKRQTMIDEAKDALRRARESRSMASRTEVEALKRAQPADDVIDDLMARYENVKVTLGDISEQADDALATANIAVPKSDVKKFIDDAISDIGPAISETSVAARRKLTSLKERIDDAFGDALDGPQLRDTLKQVRQDINWNVAAPDFNTVHNKLLKNVQKNISKSLKGKAPNYGKLMEESQKYSQALEAMSKPFGTREKARSTIQRFYDAKGRDRYTREAFENFDRLTGGNFTERLKSFRDKKALLDQKKIANIDEKIVPNLVAAEKAAEKKLTDLQARYGRMVRKISRDRTQSIITRQGYKNASVEDFRALEELSKDTGINFNKLIKDRTVADAFMKDATNGSRRVNLLGILGFIVGSPLGLGPEAAAAAAAGGAALDNYGSRVLKQLIDKNPSKAGLLFVEQNMKKAATKLDQMPEILGRMSTARKRGRTRQIKAIEGLWRIMDKPAAPKEQEDQASSKLKMLDGIRDKATQWVANPDGAIDQFSSLSSVVSMNGAPQIGASFAGKMSAVANYINQIIPKPPRPESPFHRKRQYKPTDSELTAFEQKLEVLNDPFIVLEELENGTLSSNHMEALKAIYPGIHGMISKKIQDAVQQNYYDMEYVDRMKLSLLIDAPVDHTMAPDSIDYYQNTWQSEEGQAAEQGMLDEVIEADVDLANYSLTEQQQLLKRRQS